MNHRRVFKPGMIPRRVCSWNEFCNCELGIGGSITPSVGVADVMYRLRAATVLDIVVESMDE